MAHQGVSTRRVKDITTELCGRDFSSWAALRLAEELDEQVRAWAERPFEQEYLFLVPGCPCNSKSGGRRPCDPGDLGCWPLA